MPWEGVIVRSNYRTSGQFIFKVLCCVYQVQCDESSSFWDLAGLFLLFPHCEPQPSCISRQLLEASANPACFMGVYKVIKSDSQSAETECRDLKADVYRPKSGKLQAFLCTPSKTEWIAMQHQPHPPPPPRGHRYTQGESWAGESWAGVFVLCKLKFISDAHHK